MSSTINDKQGPELAKEKEPAPTMYSIIEAKGVHSEVRYSTMKGIDAAIKEQIGKLDVTRGEYVSGILTASVYDRAIPLSLGLSAAKINMIGSLHDELFALIGKFKIEPEVLKYITAVGKAFEE